MSWCLAEDGSGSWLGRGIDSWPQVICALTLALPQCHSLAQLCLSSEQEATYTPRCDGRWAGRTGQSVQDALLGAREVILSRRLCIFFGPVTYHSAPRNGKT